MKLYATTTSERNSRPAKKGGDRYIKTELTYKDRGIGRLVVNEYNGAIVKYISPEGKETILYKAMN